MNFLVEYVQHAFLLIGLAFIIRSFIILSVKRKNHTSSVTTSSNYNKTNEIDGPDQHTEGFKEFMSLLDEHTNQIHEKLNAISHEIDINSNLVGEREYKTQESIKEDILNQLNYEEKTNNNEITETIQGIISPIVSSLTNLEKSISEKSIEEKEYITQMVETELQKNQNHSLEDIEAIINQSISQINNQPELLEDEQIRKAFINAIISAEEELCIVSPWVNEKVLEDYIPYFKAAIKKGVTIKILYGYTDSYSPNDKSIKTDQAVHYLKRQLTNVRPGGLKMKKVNTHFKLTICDEKFYLIGSYNFLSFGGKYNEETRHEAVEYSENKERIQEYKERYFRF
ncbi:phospholipase D-like domain-containing protein [Alkalibacillus haloalkaliphilus]|uniref:phospholipase D-like domain-containing protein n=1 Tax=Alkalibacillus haloalkaliphilus TaxID=94136 RepID=UPI0029362A67|nr:phospholipase D-like domain-containing protein [Alkalibacillus haloalkaliphilus]MDV2582169.1 phospholipase D-like domain-containing protein [Alkalibacillus haloalkaliphilus]